MKRVLLGLVLVLAGTAAPAAEGCGACGATAVETPRGWLAQAMPGAADDRRLLVPMLAGAVSLLVVLRAVRRAPNARPVHQPPSRSSSRRARAATIPRVGRYRRDPAAERCGRLTAIAALHLPPEAAAPSQAG